MTFLDAETWRGKVYSGGWVTAQGEAAVTEPATGSELGRTGIAGPGDVAAAVGRAAAAQAAWAATPYTQRAAILRQAGEIWLANADLVHEAIYEAYVSALAEKAAHLPVGIVHINEQTVDDEPDAPFGGVLASGTGARFGGTANLEAFTDTRWVTVRCDIAPYPF